MKVLCLAGKRRVSQSKGQVAVADDSKGFLSTIQEKAVSLFHMITGESEEDKEVSSGDRRRRGGRRRPRSDKSENEHRERRRRRRQRRQVESEDDENEPISRRRRHRRNPHRSNGDIARFEPRRGRRQGYSNDAIAENE